MFYGTLMGVLWPCTRERDAKRRHGVSSGHGKWRRIKERRRKKWRLTIKFGLSNYNRIFSSCFCCWSLGSSNKFTRRSCLWLRREEILIPGQLVATTTFFFLCPGPGQLAEIREMNLYGDDESLRVACISSPSLEFKSKIINKSVFGKEFE